MPRPTIEPTKGILVLLCLVALFGAALTAGTVKDIVTPRKSYPATVTGFHTVHLKRTGSSTSGGISRHVDFKVSDGSTGSDNGTRLQYDVGQKIRVVKQPHGAFSRWEIEESSLMKDVEVGIGIALFLLAATGIFFWTRARRRLKVAARTPKVDRRTPEQRRRDRAFEADLRAEAERESKKRV